MPLIKLTRRGCDTPTYVNPEAIVAISGDMSYHAGRGRMIATGQANILAGGAWLHVAESAEEVAALVEHVRAHAELQAAARAAGVPVIDLRLAEIDPSDKRGLPVFG